MDNQINIKILHKLHRKGLINKDAYISANTLLRPTSEWFTWAKNMLLLVGSVLVLAGIIFFFAYNWADMGKFFKLGLIETGIITCIIGSLYKKDTLSGKVLLLSASILVGVFLAVYGQIYQTGADAFELFLGWSILILGWVIVSNFGALWMTSIVLLNTGTILFWDQIVDPVYNIRYEYLCIILVSINLSMLIFKELGSKYGMKWLDGKWIRITLLLAIMTQLSIPTIGSIINNNQILISKLLPFIWMGIGVGVYLSYRYIVRDILSIALLVMNICVIILVYLGETIFSGASFRDEENFLLFAFVIMGVVSSSVFLLRKITLIMAKESKIKKSKAAL